MAQAQAAAGAASSTKDEVVIVGDDGTEHVFPPGFDPKKAAALVRGRTGAPIRSGPPSLRQRAGQTLTEGMSLGPTIGATVGSVAGGRVGGAVGGAAGKGYEELITHAKELPGAVKDIYQNLKDPAARGATIKGFGTGMKEGAVSAAGAAASQAALGEVGTQTIGRISQWASPKIARWLMNTATRNVAKQILNDFPGVRDEMIDQALTISGGGLDRAEALLSRWSTANDQVVALAEQQGLTVPVKMNWEMFNLFKSAFTNHLNKKGLLLPETRGVIPMTARLPSAARKLLLRVGRAASKNQWIDLTPSQADLYKSELQAFTRGMGGYEQQLLTKGRPATKLQLEEMKTAATSVNNWIEKIAKSYQATNKNVQTAIGAKRVIESQLEATQRGGFKTPIIRAGVVGASAAGAAVGLGSLAGHGTAWGLPAFEVGAVLELLDNPRVLSYGAVNLKKPAVQAVIAGLPPRVVSLLTSVIRQGRNSSPEDLARVKALLETGAEPATRPPPP